MSKLKLGIYGGTFSPPHLGHVRAAESFVRGVGLDKLLIMPDYMPPHKDDFGDVSAEDRLEMCRIAFAELSCTEVSDYEIRKGGKSYTYITLQAFSSDEVELYFLCGTDMLLTLDSWKNPDVIFDLATICFVRRESDSENDAIIEKKISEYEERFSARIIALDHDVLETSSTELRRNVGAGATRLSCVPDRVARYIAKKGLYR